MLLLISINCFANEKKPEKESTVFNKTFSWQAQLGLSLHYVDNIIKDTEQSQLGDYLKVSLLFDFYYKGFFIQSNHRRADTHTLGAELGYQLEVNDDWEIDIISKTYIGGIDADTILDQSGKEGSILEGLKTRDVGTGLAIRYTHYFDNSYFSIDLANLAVFSGAKGWVLDGFYSHLIPYRNWDIYLNAGLTLYSENVMDYYLGIDESEVSSMRPYFEGSNGAKVQFEVFAQHPITQNWTFNIGVSQSYYSHNVIDSPIVDSYGATQVLAGVLYVF